VDRKVSKWFGLMERVSVERFTKGVYESEVEGRRDRGRPCSRWLGGIEKVRK